MATDWTAVIPVKRLSAAKSRLRGAVPAARHADLALAMMRDTVAAVLASAGRDRGAGGHRRRGRAAAAAAARCPGRAGPSRTPGSTTPCGYGADDLAGLGRDRAVLAGDLPALRPAELGAALAGGGPAQSFVPDAAGTGTVLLAAPAGVPLDPHFGVGLGGGARRVRRAAR